MDTNRDRILDDIVSAAGFQVGETYSADSVVRRLETLGKQDALYAIEQELLMEADRCRHLPETLTFIKAMFAALRSMFPEFDLYNPDKTYSVFDRKEGHVA